MLNSMVVTEPTEVLKAEDEGVRWVQESGQTEADIVCTVCTMYAMGSQEIPWFVRQFKSVADLGIYGRSGSRS